MLIENGHARVAKAYILYREERARRRREKAARGYRESSNIPWRKIYEVLRWSVDHDLHTVEQLNARIARGEFARIVQESERAYEEDIDTAAQLILQQRRTRSGWSSLPGRPRRARRRPRSSWASGWPRRG